MLAYPKVRALGDPTIAGILDGEITVEEKLDGSQMRVHLEEGTMSFGSHHIVYTNERPVDKMYEKGVEIVKQQIKIFPKQPTTIFAEFFSGKRHNTLHYNRVPSNSLVIFDVRCGETWLSAELKKAYAEAVGFEVPQVLFQGNGKEVSIARIKDWLETESSLGGTKIEGIVVKNYNKLFDGSRYPWLAGFWLVGKYVREEFKEANRENWKNIKKGAVETLVESLRTEARWNKAVQRLRENSKLTNTPKDIPEIMRAVVADIEDEEGENIKQALWEHYWKSVKQGVVKGIPEWWKEKMLENLQ